MNLQNMCRNVHLLGIAMSEPDFFVEKGTRRIDKEMKQKTLKVLNSSN